MSIIKQSEDTFEQLNQLIRKHVEDRDWDHNTSRSLAISIALEVNELLEHYQWSEKSVGGQEELAEELADVFIYAFQFAQANDIDIADAIKKKLQKAALKYPAKHFKGKSVDAQHNTWMKAKLNYKKDGL